MRKVTPHADVAELERLFPSVREFQVLASKYGIHDIFQDNGGKLLQVLLHLGLHNVGKREGNDAKDEDGNEYELKSVNTNLVRSFSTHHHLVQAVIDKYRKVGWYFAVYNGIELQAIYYVEPAKLEPFFLKWETPLAKGSRNHWNNPKIPLKFVQEHGVGVWPPDADPLFFRPNPAPRRRRA